MAPRPGGRRHRVGMAGSLERLALPDALGRWLGPVLPLPEEALVAPSAGGRVLARPLSAWRALPAFARSAVDGYAVRAADLAAGASVPVRADAVWAGHGATALGPAEAVFVATGGGLPEGADAVLPIELAALGDGRLTALRPIGPGANVRTPGEDLAAGAQALGAGERLDADRLPLALAASAGRPIMVGRRPRVCILPIGDELTAPGRAPDGPRVMEVVGPALAARARDAGALAELLAPLPDDLGAVAAAVLAAAGRADLVATIGGASVGARDHAAEALVAAGGDVRFHGVALRPGTPTFGGHLAGAAVLGLPGNPVAALTAWELFGRVALSRLAGEAPPATLQAVLAAASDKRPVRDDRYLRAAVWAEGGVVRARVWQGQNAGMLLPLARTNALVRHPAGVDRLAAGTLVDARLTGAILEGAPAWCRT